MAELKPGPCAGIPEFVLGAEGAADGFGTGACFCALVVGFATAEVECLEDVA